MELREIITEYRIQADDTAAQPKTTDETLALWASEAEREACERAKLILDTSDTTDLTTFAISADQATVTLPDIIHEIFSAQFTSSAGGRAKTLEFAGLDWIVKNSDWRTESCARPDYIAHASKTLARLYPVPNTAGTLQLTVYRLPLYDMEDASDEPEIPTQYHRALIHWMLYKTYLGKDGEQEDPARASRELDLFEARFGKRHNARAQRMHYQRNRITTRPI